MNNFPLSIEATANNVKAMSSSWPEVKKIRKLELSFAHATHCQGEGLTSA